MSRHKTNPMSILEEKINGLREVKKNLWLCRNNMLVVKGQHEKLESGIEKREHHIIEYIREMTSVSYSDKEGLEEKDMYQ